MSDEFAALRQSPPERYNWQQIAEFDLVDKRAFLIEELCGSRIGVMEADLKWQPKRIPPADEEILGWLWVIRPDLEPQILAEASETLRNVISAFRNRS